MKDKKRQFGFTLMEMLVVISIIALLAAMVVPAFPSMIRSHKMKSAKNLIKSALAQAQAYAALNQKYAGVRFQYNPDGWQKGKQYVVLIEKHPTSTNANWYSVVPNAKPVTLSNSIGLIAMSAVDIPRIYDDVDPCSMLDETTFSIIFSPTGQLVTKNISVNPRDYNDKVINHVYRVESPIDYIDKALLYCDSYIWEDFDVKYRQYLPVNPKDWLVNNSTYPEVSESGLYIFETEAVAEIAEEYSSENDAAEARSIYINSLKPILINIYTGTIIDEDF